MSDDRGTGDVNSEGSEVGGEEPSDELEGGEDAVFEALTEETGVLSDNGNDVGCRKAFGGQEVEFGEKPSGGVAYHEFGG